MDLDLDFAGLPDDVTEDEAFESLDRLSQLQEIAASQTEEALELLSIDYANQPRWFSKKLDDPLGPLLKDDLVIVAARPGNGKTTLLLNQAASFVEQGHKVVYVGTEMKPARLKIMMACNDLGYDPALVLQGQWHRLPTNARPHVIERVRHYESKAAEFICPPIDRPTLADLLYWIAEAHNMGCNVVMIDHLHRMNWGDPTRRFDMMTEGMRKIKSAAKQYEMRILAAAQLKRGGANDPLADYMIPPPDAIKDSAAAEEEADAVVMLHRALKEGVDDKTLGQVRYGMLPLRDVIEPGCMVAHVSKSRLAGDARDEEIRLYVGRGRLFDDPVSRDQHVFHMPVRAGDAAAVPAEQLPIPDPERS